MSQPYQRLSDGQKLPIYDAYMDASGILPSGEANFEDENQVLQNPLVNPQEAESLFQPTRHAFVNASGISNPDAALVYNEDTGYYFNTTSSGNPLSNAPQFLGNSSTFQQGDYIHYIPLSNGGQGELDKVPYALNFDPSVVIKANTTPYYRYG